ncbi:isocitrate lyase/phosphoenolpyruvate mutase family protein [Streptomyces pluripotens]|uniref:Isocitrate lyase/phosphoenolpyruvate mutase family protein n=1 Tax=Streptomyces pluripotens TaxID=1355015 RepID=A0A221P688_9ACTN|nr:MULTISPECIES: isocitrate lyase/phosphoenolpyruvate mutase family protein [Streptomyces]ARP73044.1 carboxyvinyl-carboxyphosphonate phosphorylmutase [Streptomyces pluripotens]ASN27295.1 isocitrate lyase/phosphoenolpyruvate mutase family protein [Streptomyces pluripotens]KIE28720.1 carboxyvinyl-carboxyphosphonate phosphorylmutase [Streptomyces sp. MUSC 125]MCH0557957.1 isocitrate lyase/phosphoenolpyruvate mutase family protein [Streptomyces sp. MUM 16J]
MRSLTPAESFRRMHEREEPASPLIIPNVWDAFSARVFAGAGHTVLATSSAAVAAVLGYEDGGHTPVDEMFAAIARITRAVDVPVTADIEDGYGLSPREIVDRLLEAGVVGCNLEDSVAASGEVKDPLRHADWLAEVSVAAGDRIVLNARIDTFLHGDGSVESAVKRARLYAEAGVDCVYPILAPTECLPDIVSCVDRPVNALRLPDGPTSAELGTLGVARVTFGHTLHRRAASTVLDLASDLT